MFITKPINAAVSEAVATLAIIVLQCMLGGINQTNTVIRPLNT
jgi:hypothetical protein